MPHRDWKQVVGITADNLDNMLHVPGCSPMAQVRAYRQAITDARDELRSIVQEHSTEDPWKDAPPTIET